MSGIPFDGWVDRDYYLEEMAKMHKINPKLDVIQLLNDQVTRLNDESYAPLGVRLERAERQWLRVELSAQIVALSLELTDDLAAVCEAYLKALAAGEKSVVLHVANFERADGDEFYKRVSSDGDQAVIALGLDAPETPGGDKERYRKLLEDIQKARLQFWQFYNGYKHGQYATPIVVGGGTANEKWGLYLIPKRPRVDDGRVHTEGEARFIDTVSYVSNFVGLAKISWNLWLDTVNRQFPKVFGR